MSARNVEQEFDAMKSDFGKLSADLVNLTKAMQELTGHDAKEYLAKLRTVMDKATNEVEAATTILAAKGREGITSTGRQMQEHPLASILVCFGLGVVIGKLIDR